MLVIAFQKCEAPRNDILERLIIKYMQLLCQKFKVAQLL